MANWAFGNATNYGWDFAQSVSTFILRRRESREEYETRERAWTQTYRLMLKRDATVKHLAFGNNAEDGWHTLLRLATPVVPIDIISFLIFVTFSPFTCWAIVDSCDNISR